MNGLVACGPDWPTRLRSLAVFGLFAGLLVIDHGAATLGSLLALAGLVALGRQWRLSASEREFLLLMALLPLGMLVNMALTDGWSVPLLNRPFRLLYAFLLYLALVRGGFARSALFWGCLAGAIAAAGFAAVELLVVGQSRANGITNAVPFGNFSLLLGLIAAAGALSGACTTLRQRPARARGLALLGLAAGILASIASGSRGGWIALPWLLLLLCLAPPRRPTLRTWLAGAGVALTLLLVLASLPTVQARYHEARQEVAALFEAPDSADAQRSSTGLRLTMWRWGLDTFLSAPLTGIGHAHARTVRADAIAAGRLPPETLRMANVHNEIINTLAVSGVIGLGFLLAFWAGTARFFLRRLQRHPDQGEVRFHALAGLLTLAATFLFALTEGLFGTTVGALGLAIGLAVPAAALTRLEQEGRPLCPEPPT